ncbi:MAG: hypothetical protein ACJ76H_01095 [Bacteriovoracaceae bacterium]
MIYNKSGHPVEVKKISIRMWSLRDEIEAALERRMKECEAAGVPLFIEDIKSFYNLNMKAPLTDRSNVLPLRAGQASSDDLNSLMASLKEEDKVPETEETKSADEVLATLDDNKEPPKTFSEAEETLAEQAQLGADNKKPNPILERPYQRQAPDLDLISYGFCFLSDIHMENLLAFTQGKFLQGQSVVVEFLIPQNFMMTADVTYCHYYALRSRIISSTKPDYRVQCKFSFGLAGEREKLRSFLKSIEPTVTEKKRVKKETEDENLGL